MLASSKPNKRISQDIKSLLMASGFAACLISPMSNSAEPSSKPNQPANNINFQIKARPLGEVLKEIAVKSGINFKLADGLQKDKVTATLSGKDWSEASQSLLKGYNYAVEVGKAGEWQTVTVSGKNGDGKLAGGPAVKFQTYTRTQKADLPSRLQSLNNGSVTPITLPLATLKGMKPGKKISLDLPSGPSNFVHDNRFEHKNGDVTWVGYPENDGVPNRAMIAIGKYGTMGHIITDEGAYQIITEDGQTYLVDINASGLESGSLLEDQAIANPDTASSNAGLFIVSAGGSPKSASTSSNSPNSLPTPYNTSTTGGATKSNAISTIDLLVIYSKGLEQPETRINYLTDLTNQAFLDSKINAKIRVVKIEAVDYNETGDNSEALSDLTNGTAPFDKIKALREKNGADLVTLIRPFHGSSQKGCGIAWVNGVNGGAISPFLGYSVASDGMDKDGQLVYCGEQTLAHELGHNLGNVHDRPFTDAAGAYPYSYAWGVDGSFGTIMSYRRPSLLVFATPLLGDACHGQPCGYPEGNPNASDNTATINQIAPTVAGFLPTVITDKPR